MSVTYQLLRLIFFNTILLQLPITISNVRLTFFIIAFLFSTFVSFKIKLHFTYVS